MVAPDQARWQRVRDVFDAVADVPVAARAERLAALCGDDAGLRREVESLLAHDASPGDPIGQAVGRAALAATDAASPAARGRALLHYRLTEPIGEGGMGVVWRAVDETLGRDVAIKLLPPSVGDDPRRLARFEREAKLLASLNHTNIAAIFSLHAHEGVRFLAMEYVPGEDLAARLARGRMPLDEVLRVARQIAEALEEAHERGVVHRDLKPANVKLTPSGKVKVLDFGLAKVFLDEPAGGGSSTSSASALAPLSTREGVVLGTAAYMPPEQARGAVVDKRADIWAFGVVVFEMLAGRRPFTGDTIVDQLAAIVTAEPDWDLLPSSTPPAMVRLLRRCLQKEARQRLRDIGDARIELDQLGGEPHDATAGPSKTSSWARRAGWLAAAAAVVGAAIGAGFWAGRQAAPAIERPAGRTIAVLPLLDLSAGEHDEYFADGLTEELLNLLARNPQLRVAGRTSSFRFKDTHQDARAIGRTLGVSSLLEGSVRRSGSHVRITAQLVNVEDGFHLWSSAYDRELEDMVLVQDEIARSVADALQVALLGGPSAAPALGGGHNGPAYNAYLQGRYFRGRNTKEGLEKAVAYFEEAVRLDGSFAPAWAGLSSARSAMGAEGYAPPDTVAGEARRAADRAVALDPLLAEGHMALSIVRRAYDWDWAGADAAAQRALQLEPNNADIVFGAGRVASTLGRLDEAIALTRRAAALDPLNVQVHYRLGRYLQFVGQLDAARASLTKGLELDGDYPGARENLALVLLAQGRAEAALAELAREKSGSWRAHGEAIAFQMQGRKAEADAALARLVAGYQAVAAFQIAQIHALRGEADEAMDWLDRAYQQRDTGLSQLKSTSYFDRLAGEPRFQAFLDQMRLPR